MSHMADFPPLVTPQEAKRVWDRQRRPSARVVAKALTQAGRPVHFTTVARWRRKGWRRNANSEHSPQTARKPVDASPSAFVDDQIVIAQRSQPDFPALATPLEAK